MEPLLQEFEAATKGRGRNAERIDRGRWQRLVELSPDGFFEWDLNTGSTWFSANVEALLPRPKTDGPVGFARLQEIVVEADRTRLLLAIRRHLEQREPLEAYCALTNGQAVRLLGQAERDETGRPFRLVGVLHDVTGKQRLIADLHANAENWRSIVDSMRVSTAVLDARGEIIELNPRWREDSSECGLTGLRYGFGENYVQLLANSGDRCAVAPRFAQQLGLVLAGQLPAFQGDYETLIDGQPHAMRMFGRAMQVEDRHLVIVMHADLTAMGLEPLGSAATAAVLRTMLNAVPQQVAYVDRDGRLRHMNAAYERWAGVPAESIVGQRLADLVSPANWSEIAERIQQVSNGRTVEFAARAETPNGDRELMVRYVPDHGVGGVVRGFTSIVNDVTAERRLAGDLRQAQKMDAIGHLAGGIAHDFNNLLNVIVGNLQLADRASGLDPRAAQAISAALRAALRGAELTQRLLTFSRQQDLEPSVVDSSQLIDGMRDMFERSLPETIRCVFRLRPHVWPVRIDPVQLETALLNLVINARDAMPDGGDIHIVVDEASFGARDTSRPPALTPGDYVVITVQDHGTGMSAETLRRAFEPFFTTKEVGKGTGLGLAMVYGFVHQSGGTATIDSLPGEGTTVRLYIPRHNPAAHAGSDPQTDTASAAPGAADASPATPAGETEFST